MKTNVFREDESLENRKDSLKGHPPQIGQRLAGNAIGDASRMILEGLSTRTKGVVLVVDRDPVARNVVCQELARRGYMVLEAADCGQAILIMQECAARLGVCSGTRGCSGV